MALSACAPMRVLLVAASVVARRSSVAMRVDQGFMRRDDLSFDGVALKPEKDLTVSGCTCQSQCAATFLNDLSKCDWCYTEGVCGRGSFRKWDYCTYPQYEPWESLSHTRKMEELWGQITSEDMVGRSSGAKDAFSTLTQMVGESMRTVMDNHRDVNPSGRSKVIHVQGAHCQFELNIEKSPLSGLLGVGAHRGLIRMGSASPLAMGFFPGISVKFLRSSVQSANFVALRETGSGGSNDFFAAEAPLANHVAPPKALQLIMKFDQASSCTSMVGLSDVCSMDQDGNPVEKLEFPYKIVFKGTGKFSTGEEAMTDADFLRKLSSIPVGTHLFDVYVQTHPKTEALTFLGEFKTASACVQSLFGDEHLSFRHQRMEEDFVLRPEWIADISQDGCHPKAEPSSSWQCPGVH